MQLAQQIALVTGAGSGMGYATAKHLAAKGCKVICVDINEKNLQQVAEEIKGYALALDVSDASLAAEGIAKACEAVGVPRVVVNCAGIAPAKRIVGKSGPHSLTEFNQVLQVNLVGSFNIMRLCAEKMMSTEPTGLDGERGVIIHTASIAAYEGQIGQAAYSASKGGIVAMTLPAAREFAQFGIRVMTIAPGIIATPMMTSMPEAVQTSLAEQIPFPKRLGAPEEYADCVEFIVTNPLLNGSVIRLDGAIRMQAK